MGQTEVGHRQRDEPAELIGQCFAGGSVRSRPAGHAAVDDDVRVAGQFEQASPIVIVGRIEDRRPLVRVVQRERDADPGQGRCRPPSGAAGRRLDLEHFGTEVGQDAGHRIGIAVGEIEDPKPGQQWTAHAGQPTSGAPRVAYSLSPPVAAVAATAVEPMMPRAAGHTQSRTSGRSSPCSRVYSRASSRRSTIR